MTLKPLEDRPGQLRDLRALVARAVGAPVEPPQVTLWTRLVRWWRNHGS
jgi:hypothetical protein